MITLITFQRRDPRDPFLADGIASHVCAAKTFQFSYVVVAQKWGHLYRWFFRRMIILITFSEERCGTHFVVRPVFAGYATLSPVLVSK